jgi:hypothetical protein
MTTTTIRGRVARLAAASALSLATLGVVSAATTDLASAATCCGSLSIAYRADLPSAKPYLVSVYGRAAKYYNPTTTRAEVRLWGDDTSSDDFLAGPYTATWNGSEAFVEFAVSGATLDEDWGTDEIYAGIRIVDRATGKVLEGIETFRVTANF